MPRRFKPKFFFVIAVWLVLPLTAFAHENYVLSHEQIDQGMRDFSLNVLNALKDPVNLRMSLAIGALITLGVILYFFFERSRLGIWLDERLKTAEGFGHVVLRLALAFSFLFSAYKLSF